MSFFDRLILQCRAGFEKEAAAEITDRAGELGFYGYCSLAADSGYLNYILPEPGAAEKLIEALAFRSLIFIRQWAVSGPCLELDPADRIAQLLPLLETCPVCTELVVEYPDTGEGRELAAFARKFGSALAQPLRRQGRLQKDAQARLSLFVLSGQRMYLGYIPRRNGSGWSCGILRLKFPHDAPSRSTLKLEEAWHWFVPAKQWDERLAFGVTAVDLGAAPGGWTWQLVKRNMFVTAVDNGPMHPDLMASGQVEHVQEDAYRFVPDKPVQWMVCDVVEKPVRTAQLAVDWLVNGWCQEMIFNLKLPMKQRYQETRQCLDLIADSLGAAGVKYQLSARHLYHDREEITCHLRRL
ncbi:23S rRNA (cytidine(2498)-2'-O)-methyltransferase RlmM [Pontibacter sp. JAM-7]|uniref:23S rRNA (cytidine(2498)-2'-O)-methyltransferase RlmM n=1 Tax=Pontibacter sp. JAM-7 TaxID=3366581 RepID=UPI003AF89B0C